MMLSDFCRKCGRQKVNYSECATAILPERARGLCAIHLAKAWCENDGRFEAALTRAVEDYLKGGARESNQDALGSVVNAGAGLEGSKHAVEGTLVPAQV